MDGEVTIQQPLTLRGFCESVFLENSKDWPPDECTIAQEFVAFFQIDTFPTLGTLQRLCHTLGMRVREQDLPKGIRGFNHHYEDHREIVIGTTRREAQALGSREHTLLHEVREQIEYEFHKIGHPVATNSDKEHRADHFASFVRLYASGKAALPLATDLFSEASSGLAKFGMIVLAVIVSLGFALSCLALPQWEDKL
ncbi:MAG: hypothetical protein ACR2IF_09900 [Terriglobales bacterium]